MKKSVVLSWSGGKDSAMALERLQQEKYEIRYLLTTLSKEHRRISMHGVREKILDEQARLAGIPLVKIYISGEEFFSYEEEMKKINERFKEEGITGVAFGDIFLEDLRVYREKMLASANLKAYFPLWKENTGDLLKKFESDGYKAKICAGDARFFSEDDMGKDLSEGVISSVNSRIDPCGENGEYHTLIYMAPYFKRELQLLSGIVEKKTYQWKDESGDKKESSFLFRDFCLKN